MANRSYLYSTNTIPGTDARQRSQIVGISEWNHDIPIVYKLLLAGNPRTCKSTIWEMPNHIALIGDYSVGLLRLKGFLKRIDLPAAQPLVHEALAFLEKEVNRREYFLLECGEIFGMTGAPMQEQNSTLLEEIKNLDAEAEKSISDLLLLPVEQPELTRPLAAGRSGVESPQHEANFDLLQPVYRLGLGGWSNNLYYDPSP